MMPTDKGAEADVQKSDASAIHPFDRFISDVYARKSDDLFSLDTDVQEGAGADAQSPSSNGESSSGGSEKLRAEIIARARESEERVREATEKFKQVEAKHRQEQALRRLAEQRAEEIEEEYKQRLAAAQAADLMRLEMELTLAETKVRLKQETEALRLTETALARVKDDAKIQTQASSRAIEEAENYIGELEARIIELEERTSLLKEAERRIIELESKFREAQAKAAVTKSAEAAVEAAERRIAELDSVIHDLKEKAAAVVPIAVALEKAERRIGELETGYREIDERAVAAESNALALEAELISTARNLGEKTALAESSVIVLDEARKRIAEMEVGVRESENKAGVAAESAREMELLKREAEARENEVQKKFDDAEVRLQLEIEMRMTAEKRVQALENKFKSELEMDWNRFKADIEEAEAAVKAREKAISQISAPEELIQELTAQLEEEKRVRGEIERRLAESETGVDHEKAKSLFEAERRLAEMDAELKTANATRAEAERKLAEFVSGASELQAYFNAAGINLSDTDALLATWKRSGPLGAGRLAKREKIFLVGYGAAAALLSMLLFLLLYLGFKSF